MLDGIILSRNNLHHQLNQPPTPAHNHQSTNHEHLQSLTTTIHKLTHLSHSSAGLKVAWLTTLVDVRLSARPSWNWSLPVETQVYLQWYCTSCFHCTLRYLSYVGSPAWVTLNKLPFDSQLPVSLTSVWHIHSRLLYTYLCVNIIAFCNEFCFLVLRGKKHYTSQTWILFMSFLHFTTLSVPNLHFKSS